MRLFVILTFTLGCGWLGEVQAQSMTQREAYEKMAEIYEAAGMHDLAEQSRHLGRNLDSVQPMAPTYIARPPQRRDVNNTYRQMKSQEAERNRQYNTGSCYGNGCAVSAK